MDYQNESNYLDLKKNLYNISYEKLVDNSKKKTFTASEGKFDMTTTVVKTEDLLSNTILYFQDKKLIQEDISNICIYLQKMIKKEKVPEGFPLKDLVFRVSVTLWKYMEMPSLLDNMVEFIIKWVIETIRMMLSNYLEVFISRKELLTEHQHMNQLLSIIYSLFTIRGVKNTKKYFSHTTSDFEPLMFFVFSCKFGLKWESRYVLLEWFSVILLMPFDYRRLDSELITQLEEMTSKPSEINPEIEMHFRILNFLKSKLRDGLKIAESVGRCMSILMRRPELQSLECSSDLLDWVFSEMMQEKAQVIPNNGYLENLYKVIQRLIKELPKKLCEELFEQLEEFLLDELRGKSKKESNTSHYAKIKAYILIFEKVLRSGKVRIFYRAKKKNMMENVDPNMIVEMITDQTSMKMRSELKNRQNNELNIEQSENIHIQEELPQETESCKIEEETDLEEEEEYDVNIQYIDQIEHFVDIMFENLKSTNYPTRFLAGRGLSRIACKLSSDMVEEIIDCLLLLIEDDVEEDENLFHGVCLALGELSNAGLVIPALLPRVIPILKRALIFEVVKGNHASGNIVRDAGCYISWAFARGFDSEILTPYVKDLAGQLLLTALFDAQGNCRRAAAAAFQENVGRQGQFPNGIAIISEMDYFSVGIVTNSFTRIAPFVASFPEYTRKFIDHLAFNRLAHISEDIRVLASQSLAIISLLDPDYICKEVFPLLIKRATSRLLSFRHGALMGIGSLLFAFSGKVDLLHKRLNEQDSIFLKTLKINEKKLVSHGEYMETFLSDFAELKTQNYLSKIDPENRALLHTLLPILKQKKMLKGIGGELTRLGVCFLAESLAVSNETISQENIMQYLEFFERCIKMTIERVQIQAAVSLDIFAGNYMTDTGNKQFMDFCRTFLRKFYNEIVKHVKVSYIQAIASLSKELLSVFFVEMFMGLLANSLVNRKLGNNDPEVRRVSLRTLFKMIKKVGVQVLEPSDIQKISETLSKTIKDYTLDKRGDIGCIVREETLSFYLDFLSLVILTNNHKLLEPMDLPQAMYNILTQILQPNDRLRLRAGYTMQILVDQLFPSLPNFEGKEILTQLFSNKQLRMKFKDHQDKYFDRYDVSIMDDKKFLAYNQNTNFVYFWNVPQCTYPYLAPLLKVPVYRRAVLSGYVLSYSSSIDSINSHVIEVFTEFFNSDDGIPGQTIQDLLKILSEFKKKQKFSMGVFKIMDLIFREFISDFNEEVKAFSLRIIRAIDIETKNTKSLQKLTATGSLLISIISIYEDLSLELYLQKILPLVNRFLLSEYPIVTKNFSEQFYMFLITKGEDYYGAEMANQLAEMLSLLEWGLTKDPALENFAELWNSLNDLLTDS